MEAPHTQPASPPVSSRSYCFTTHWDIDAPIEQVWSLLANPQDWPQWWPGCEKVIRTKTPGRADSGPRYFFIWRGRLPHRLKIEMAIEKEEPLQCLAGAVTGELIGWAGWCLSETRTGTAVRFDFEVDGPKPWMRRLAPLTRSLFYWNHRQIMEQGRIGLKQRLEGNPGE